ncbi:MAG TPA: glycerate kinase [Mucilaginibacter sp.]|jgi:glycerate kinase|nr:glycerate kinase [Mucilaginibacter sp.]
MNILIAPNAFKNSLSAADASAAIEEGLQQSKLNCTTYRFPIADGGDGTGPLIIEKCKGRTVKKEVHDPLGRRFIARFGLIDNGKTAVIEMADASGLRLLKKDELNPMLASSAGTGELIKYALDEGVNKILIAMGGSATVDGGCGILSALGMRFFNADGELLRPVPRELAYMAKIDVVHLDKRLAACEIIVLCDVNNKLLGPQGSAAVFGPQKGATPAEVVKLDDFLGRMNDVAQSQFGKNLSELKYGGTAGGAAAGLCRFLNAKLVNGIEYFLGVTGFAEELKKADILITGEGSIDSQTLQGKGPYGVARLAKVHKVPVIGLAGKVPLEPDEGLLQYFDVLMAIGNGPADLADALQNTSKNLIRTAKIIGDLILVNRWK